VLSAEPARATQAGRDRRCEEETRQRQTCTMCVHASPAHSVRARAVRAVRATASCARAAHACVSALCARRARAVCRRHVHARAHAGCARPCCPCSSCVPSCWACGALVQRSSRPCGLRSSTSSTPRGCAGPCFDLVLCILALCARVLPMLALRAPPVRARAVRPRAVRVVWSSARLHRAALDDSTSLIEAGALTCPVPILCHVGLPLSCVVPPAVSRVLLVWWLRGASSSLFELRLNPRHSPCSFADPFK